jgi:hypothetical protein
LDWRCIWELYNHLQKAGLDEGTSGIYGGAWCSFFGIGQACELLDTYLLAGVLGSMIEEADRQLYVLLIRYNTIIPTFRSPAPEPRLVLSP